MGIKQQHGHLQRTLKGEKEKNAWALQQVGGAWTRERAADL